MPLVLSKPAVKVAQSVLAQKMIELGAENQAQNRIGLGLQAGLAELMLINRLRARTRRDLSVEMLQQAAEVIEVTSRHWFTGSKTIPSKL